MRLSGGRKKNAEKKIPKDSAFVNNKGREREELCVGEIENSSWIIKTLFIAQQNDLKFLSKKNDFFTE